MFHPIEGKHLHRLFGFLWHKRLFYYLLLIYSIIYLEVLSHGYLFHYFMLECNGIYLATAANRNELPVARCHNAACLFRK